MAASANNGNPGELRKEWVRLNVGGRVFTTSRATLTKDPQSFLARIALEDTELGSDKVIYQCNISSNMQLFCQNQGALSRIAFHLSEESNATCCSMFAPSSLLKLPMWKCLHQY